MNPPVAQGPQTAEPMHGPDFVLGTVREWRRASGGDSMLVLDDGSRWHVRHDAWNSAAVSNLIELAAQRGRPVFVSGDRCSGVIDRVDLPAMFAPWQVEDVRDGRVRVHFVAHPSVYFLHAGRPWFDHARTLLRQRAARRSGDADLLVSIDPLTLEIMDVRPWPAEAR